MAISLSSQRLLAHAHHRSEHLHPWTSYVVRTPECRKQLSKNCQQDVPTGSLKPEAFENVVFVFVVAKDHYMRQTRASLFVYTSSRHRSQGIRLDFVSVGAHRYGKGKESSDESVEDRALLLS